MHREEFIHQAETQHIWSVELFNHDRHRLRSLKFKEFASGLFRDLSLQGITAIEGVEKYRDVFKKVEDLEIAEADELWDKTDDLEGGVNTLFLVECSRCEGRQQVALPFESGFFSSRKRFASSRESRSG